MSTLVLVSGAGASGGSGGGSSTPSVDTVRTISVDTTLSIAPQIVAIDTTSADVTATLPAAASMIGQQIKLYKTVAAHNAVVDAAGSETIDGALSQTMTDQWETVIVEAVSSTAWKIVANAVSVTSAGPTAPGDFTIGTVTAEWVVALAQ